MLQEGIKKEKIVELLEKKLFGVRGPVRSDEWRAKKSGSVVARHSSLVTRH